MNRIVLSLALAVCSLAAHGQATFKCGWNTYVARTITREFCYTYAPGDSTRLNFTDSSTTYVSADSLVNMCLSYSPRNSCVYKTATYLNIRKQLLKTEEYKDNDLLLLNEWRYDDKNRKVCHITDDKVKGNSFKKLYEYNRDKKSNELVVVESAYYNGRIEFYTKAYYDKNNVKQKEIRLNDNNKDVVHVENFYYADNGKLKERSVYFPEWRVTKKFPENAGMPGSRCVKMMPVGTPEKPQIGNREAFIKKLLLRNKVLLSDKECPEFEYRFTNFANCDIIVTSVAGSTSRKICIRFKERQ